MEAIRAGDWILGHVVHSRAYAIGIHPKIDVLRYREHYQQVINIPDFLEKIGDVLVITAWGFVYAILLPVQRHARHAAPWLPARGQK